MRWSVLMLGLAAASAAYAVEPDVVKIGGSTVATLEGGDYVHPAFSPDGRRLAYGGVVVQGDTELAEVFVRDLGSGRETRLLDAEAARRYAVYKSFVSALVWADDQHVTATIVDGDVDATRVSFDVGSGRIAGESDYSYDEEIAAGMERVRQRLAALPAQPVEIPHEALEQALEDAWPVSGGDLILQPQYAGVDPHLWRLDARGKLTLLHKLPPGREPELRGAFSFGNDLVLVLASDSAIELLRYRDGVVVTLTTLPATGGGWTTLLHTSPDRVLFFVRAGRSYEPTPGALYVYDRGGLHQANDYPALYDAAVDAHGRMICFVVWEKDRRHLKVHRLAAPVRRR